MGKIGKIESGKTASDAFSGCAPLDWIKEVATDFWGWMSKGFWNFVDGVRDTVGGILRGIGNFFTGTAEFIGNVPGAKQVAQFTGVFVAKGREVVGAVGGCLKAVLKGIGIGGALAVGAGGLYLLSQGGLLASIATVITVGVLARFCIRRVGLIYRFNWNITEKQIADRAKSRRLSLATQAGSAVGAGLAYFACAKAGGLAVVKFNPLAAALVRDVNEDIWQEVKQNFGSLVRSAASAFEEWLTLSLYVNVRSVTKKLIGIAFPDTGFLGKIKKASQHWGSESAKPWSFAKAIEEKIESIKFEELKNFLEEAREEFADVCSEAAYALSYGL